MRVMTIRGIAIRVHYLCFLLMLVFGICGQMMEAVVIFACVVFHELCHIVHKNHGSQFYALLESVLPDWRERKQKLTMR